MKKKGLIIATIVMVLVLAVSLTTATYAWFTVSDVTTIDAFGVSVVPNNAVNIGLKATYSAYSADDTVDDFVYGSVVYTPGEAGKLGGSWTGSTGLGATLEHNIVWGSQKKAIGVTTEDADSATLPNTKTFEDYADGMNIVAANGDTEEFTTDTVSKAVANYNAAVTTPGNEGASDYVHMVLGVQPTKTLTTNELIIILDGAESEGTRVGILAAVHVAYRINDGEWQDEEFFTCNYEAALAEQTLTLEEYQTNAYNDSYESQSKVAPTTKAGAVVIDLSAVANDNTDLAQVEIIIYIAGADDDANNSALNSKGELSIFFATV